MRDEKRILLVLATIEKVWKQHPNLRLDQLLTIACDEIMCHIENKKLLGNLMIIFNEPIIERKPKKW